MPSDVAPTQKEVLAWLAIQDNAGLAQAFIVDMTIDQFVDDRRTFYAVTRCLEIISEAARRLRGVQQDQYPHIEWRQIEDAGNIFRHVYHRVAETRVWATVQDRLPELQAAADMVLADTPPRVHRPK